MNWNRGCQFHEYWKRSRSKLEWYLFMQVRLQQWCTFRIALLLHSHVRINTKSLGNCIPEDAVILSRTYIPQLRSSPLHATHAQVFLTSNTILTASLMTGTRVRLDSFHLPAWHGFNSAGVSGRVPLTDHTDFACDRYLNAEAQGPEQQVKPLRNGDPKRGIYVIVALRTCRAATCSSTT